MADGDHVVHQRVAATRGRVTVARMTKTVRVECAGGVVLRRATVGLEVALAEQRDRNFGDLRVRLPKGHIHAGESAQAAALREVAEETGLHARVLGALGEISYRWHERATAQYCEKRVQFFLMAWTRGVCNPADGEMTRVFWTPLESAGARASFDTEREVLARAAATAQLLPRAFLPAP